ncbi:MAG: mechanosensitive ion channel [Flavobacteriales bacterium]|nr:mechanosensitive ion channel [Flavobacteriales bacterium]
MKELAEQYRHWVFEFAREQGAGEHAAKYWNVIALVIALGIILFLVDMLTRRVLLAAFIGYARRSKTKFDDYLVLNKVPRYIAHLLPITVAIQLVPYVFQDFDQFEIIAEKILRVVSVIFILWIVRSLLNTIKDFFKTLPHLKDKPIDSYIQVVMIFAWIVGIVYGFALVSGQPVWKYFTALGAASAVILLIFRDTILGFVASIQVSANDMVRIGDWITFSKYGADGDVIEINLATVKVRNFDKTITTIPTYSLISDSFQNWRGMSESDGRRIKRSIIIKQKSIRFLTGEDVEWLKKIAFIAPYLEHRQEEIDHYNASHEVDKSLPINGRNLTNIGVFRKYIDVYLNHHSAINKNMTMMVRQLAPTSEGIPLEIYCFSKDKRWENYEYIIADVFDHLLASVKFFNLEVFERIDNSGNGMNS